MILQENNTFRDYLQLFALIFTLFLNFQAPLKEMLSLDFRCNSRYEYGNRKPNGKNLSQVNFFSSFLTSFVTSKK